MRKLITVCLLLNVILATSQSLYKLPFPNGTTYTCTQGNGGSASHTGIAQYAFDFSFPSGSTVTAMRAGTVKAVVQSYPNGNCAYSNPNCPGQTCRDNSCTYCGNDVNRVVIEHTDGTWALYLHLTQNGAAVSVGQSVSQGQTIGYSGSSGCVTGAHLHVMLMQPSGCSNSWWCQSIPLSFCDFPNNGGVPITGNSCTSGSCSISSCALTGITPVVTSPGTSSYPGATITSTTPTLMWNAVSGASLYGVYIRDMTGGTTGPLVLVNDCATSGTSYNVPSGILSNGKQYRWNVIAYQSCGSGCYSNGAAPLYFQVNSCTPPAAPTGLQVTNTGCSTVNLSWNAVSGSGITYEVLKNNTSCGFGFGSSGWGPSSATTATISTTSGTDYYFVVTATNSCGTSSYSNCVNTTTASLPPTPVVSPSGPVSVCSPQTVTLTNTNPCAGCTTYWTQCSNCQIYSGSTLSNQSGSWYCYQTNSCGTSGNSNTVNVTINPIPTATASNNSPKCAGTTVNLASSGGNNYSWSGPGNYSSTQQNPSLANTQLAQSGTYTVTVTGAGNCTATASTVVTVSSVPTATANSNSPVCVGNTLTLSASGGNSYTWSGPNGYTSTQQNPTVNNLQQNQSGNYSVTVTNSSNCSATTAVSVTVNNGPNVSVTASSTNITAGQSVTLTASGANSYTWSNGGSSSSIQVSPASTTTYTVTGTSNGCTATASVTVNVAQPGCSFSVSPGIINTDSNGTTQAVTVTQLTGSNCNWSVSNSCNWLSIQGGSGTGSGSFTVSIQPNTDTITRTCTLTIDTSHLYITQTGKQGGITCPPVDTSIIVNGYDLTAQTIPNASYQWFRNGVSVGNSKYYTITQSGYYYCQITIGNCVYLTAESYYSFVGIGNISEDRITISPNPSAGSFTIAFETEQVKPFEMRVYDMTGKLLWQAQPELALGHVRKQINLQYLSKGIYLLRLQSGTEMFNRQIVIE